jgi:hypothetical protein
MQVGHAGIFVPDRGGEECGRPTARRSTPHDLRAEHAPLLAVPNLVYTGDASELAIYFRRDAGEWRINSWRVRYRK